MAKQHGTYWVVKEGQDTKWVHTDYGTEVPQGDNIIPLQTIEAVKPFDMTEERHCAVRYFERKK